MTGTMRKRGRNIWEITVERGRDAKGKRRRRSRTVHGTKADADRKQREMVAEAERERLLGKNSADAKLLVQDWLKTWLEDVVRRYPGVTTYERYTSAAEKHIIPTIGEVPISELSPRHIRAMDQALLDGATSPRGLSPRSVQITHTVLSGAYRYAIEMDQADHNPVLMSPGPKVPRHKIVPPEMQPIKRMLKLAEDEDQPLFQFLHVLTYTGMRRGEGMALDWACVNWIKGTIQIRVAAGKTHHHGMLIKPPKSISGIRAIALDARTVAVLREHRETQIADGVSNGRTGLVFPSPDGDLMKPTTITRHLKQLGERVGLPDITFHSLRHFHASVVLQEKENVAVAAERLGHSDPSVTLRNYAHVLAGWQQGAADAFASAMEGDE